MSCEHKFRSNLDNIGGLSNSSGIPTRFARESISPYVTIIFCEKCGAIAHNANNSVAMNEERQRQLATQPLKGDDK